MMIVGIYKLRTKKKINNKNRISDYLFDTLIKAEKLKTENVLIDEEKL